MQMEPTSSDQWTERPRAVGPSVIGHGDEQGIAGPSLQLDARYNIRSFSCKKT